MPIEIKELHIRVALTSSAAAAATGAAPKPAAEDKECLIAECVERVLQILQNKAER
jgi:hypothetical protein